MFRTRTLALSFGLIFLASLMLLPHQSALVWSSPNTIRVPQQYPTIQEAINAANAGDTILVSAQTQPYNGNIIVTKSLSILGVSASSVIVNASNSGPGFVINGTAGVSISQLTIQDPDSFSSAVEIISSFNVLLNGNIITSTVPSTGSNGTWIDDSHGVVLRNNTITGNLYGVAIQGGFSNTVQANNLTGNKAANLLLANATGIQIKNNFLRRSQSGVDVWYGSMGNVIERNTIANNTASGISILDSSDNQIVSNNVDFNNSTSTSKGLLLQNTTGNSLYSNNIRHNSIQMFGIFTSDLTLNTWNDGSSTPRGNFWSDYNGIDNDTSGIGDTKVPWPCPSGGRPCSSSGPSGVDYYPLMTPVKPPVLTISASGQPLSGCAIPTPLSVSFNSTVQGGSAPYTWSWKLGDGSVAGNVTTMSHNYSARGTLFATVKVNDSSLPENSGADTVAILSFSGGLTVHVRDDSSNLVGGANLTTISGPPGQARMSGLTDSQGTFSFLCLAPGKYVLLVSGSGFQSLQTKVNVSNSTIILNLAVTRTLDVLTIVLYAGIGIGIVAFLLVVWATRFRKRK